ncbi:arginine-tRNA-protein transferase [Rapidithrix thailandica]|uniref:Arginine-tRNA-protein transferase n=1 Tax=Rapidithrix thailandica TaxID=413964 RepID=A0AAW9S9R6_9BACT
MEYLIFKEIEKNSISPEELDRMLEQGWRHFGKRFFKYNLNIHNGELCNVLPLRIDLEQFKLSKRYRKILKRNQKFHTVIKEVEINPEKIELFEQHKLKFKYGIPKSIYDFLSKKPASVPCEALEFCVYDERHLVAVSFLDLGRQVTSSVYGMYDLAYSNFSLGIYTMLLEIEYSIRNGRKYYYHGYCYDISSFYDYKKKFEGVEFYDWRGNWKAL